DLSLFVDEADGAFHAALRFSTDLFDGATAARMLEHLATLAAAAAADPSRPVSALPLLPVHELHQVLHAWNDGLPPAALPVHERVDDQARRTPDAPAILGEDGQLTFRELAQASDRLAEALRRLGIGPEDLVGVCLPRVPEIAVALLAILKAGGVYLPLDPAYPRERLAYMLEQARAPLVLGRRDLAGQLPAHGARTLFLDELEPPAAPAGRACAVEPAQAAYAIFTSGSTGRPKGAVLTHGNLGCYVESLGRRLGIRAGDRYLHTASFSFSSSVRQLLLPLCHGATVVLAGPERIGEPRRLFELAGRERVTVMDLVPSYWRSCLYALGELAPEERAGLPGRDLRLIVSASERLLSDVPDGWAHDLGHGAELVNMLGQTETTGIVSVYPIPRRRGGRVSTVPVGRPIPGSRVYLLDARLEPVPTGVAGEVFLGGSGVGRGYLGQPALTAERFVPDPWSGTPGARLYRTGDLARHRADGTLDFIGRQDDQVKVRGFRIEPGEVEAALCRHPEVRAAVVLALEAPQGDRRLTAFLVPLREPAPEAAELRAFLLGILPDYMVPAAFVPVPSLPLTPTGKVDRRALAAAERPPEAARPGRVPPASPRERQLAAIWREVLGVDEIGVDDDFFALGGHSLLATQVISRIRRTFGVEIPLRTLFERPTVAALSAVLPEAGAQETGGRRVRKVERRTAARPPQPPVDQLSEQEVDRLLLDLLQEKSDP
ncbi:MAG TPA: amino acid adenylation domain-containing protein, partial [Thermoanaerobaculia bacterium]|nr:amino acid adenylation domain-containing protein [Thermoanaerobaculia bacterium]